MSRRETALDKAIKTLDDKITELALARDELLALKYAADLAAARPPTLTPVAK